MKTFAPWPVGLTLAVCGLLTACGRDAADPAAQAGEMPPPVVEIVTVNDAAAAAGEAHPGRISPVRVAEVRSRVAGIVLKREFEEGQDVEAGQVLFRIDPAPFRAELAKAQGDLAQARAELNEARSQAKRLESLAEDDAVSRQDVEIAQTRLATAEASIQSGKAMVDSAQIQLDHATVKAPIAGRIGRAMVTEGALVGQDGTPMALIQQLDPVYADFTKSVGEVLRLREAAAKAGALAARAGVTLEIAETGQTREGELLFADMTVDPGTGRVTLRGQFPNTDGLLLPGMFVRVKTPSTLPPGTVLVPQRAVVRTPDGGATVMAVVGDTQTVEARVVETGAMQDGQWQVFSGLAAGERVVASGATKVQPGMQLPPPEAAAAPADAATSTQ